MLEKLKKKTMNIKNRGILSMMYVGLRDHRKHLSPKTTEKLLQCLAFIFLKIK